MDEKTKEALPSFVADPALESPPLSHLNWMNALLEMTDRKWAVCPQTKVCLTLKTNKTLLHFIAWKIKLSPKKYIFLLLFIYWTTNYVPGLGLNPGESDGLKQISVRQDSGSSGGGMYKLLLPVFVLKHQMLWEYRKDTPTQSYTDLRSFPLMRYHFSQISQGSNK
jgi:hypothetical protein